MPDPKRDAPAPADAKDRPAGAQATEAAPPDPSNPRPAVKVERPTARKRSETTPGGRYVVDAVRDDETGEVVSGRIVNGEGDEIGVVEKGVEREHAPEDRPPPAPRPGAPPPPVVNPPTGKP
jgi:hypothetical protein